MKMILMYLVVLVTLPASVALALDPPHGPVLLSISGRIITCNTETSAQFDTAMLQALPQHIVTAETPWTEGQSVFSGPLLRDVLDLAGSRGDNLFLTAINDYQVDVPVSDALTYDVILAMSLNGEPLTIRTRGPLWLIYPWDDVDGLRSETYYARSIWQLKTIEVK